MPKKALVAILVSFLLVFIVSRANAFDASSNNFKLNAASTGSIAGRNSSASFKSIGLGGQIINGLSTSLNKTYSGILYWFYGANKAPVFVTGFVPREDPASNATASTSIGSLVTIRAQATDPNGDSWYLAICKGAGITPGTNGGAPICNNGTWVESNSPYISGAEISLNYTVSTSELNNTYDWYAYACDNNVNGSLCSPMSNSGTGNGNGSPFYVNHPVNSGVSVTSIADSAAALISNGIIIPNGTDRSNTTALNFTQQVIVSPYSGTSLIFPAGLIMSSEDGAKFTAADLVAGIGSTNGLTDIDSVGKISYGVPNVDLLLSIAATITVPVDSIIPDGTELNVFSNDNGVWHYLTNCNVASHACTFTTTALSDFSVGRKCSPYSLANGLVSAYPFCSISCNSGYYVSGSACAANSPAGSGSGGSGGGASGPANSQNNNPAATGVIFSGRAYPNSTVTLLKDAQVVAKTVADTAANFKISLTGLSSGSYIFSVYGEDAKGLRSSLLAFPVSLTNGSVVTIGSIFINPTISVDKSEVKRGDNIAIFGQSLPNSEITVSVHSDPEIFIKKTADTSGAYLLNFDTSVLDLGGHVTKSKTARDGQISSFSQSVGFIVGDQSVPLKPAFKYVRGDLNEDGKVNLIDFSIASYWYKRKLSPAFKVIEKNHLNGDAIIDLKDFSIMAFNWTG